MIIDNHSPQFPSKFHDKPVALLASHLTETPRRAQELLRIRGVQRQIVQRQGRFPEVFGGLPGYPKRLGNRIGDLVWFHMVE